MPTDKQKRTTLQPYPMRKSCYSVVFNFMPVAGLEPVQTPYILKYKRFLLHQPATDNKKEPPAEARGNE